MAPILTRLVHTDNPFKKKSHRTTIILYLFHFGKTVSNLTNWLLTGKVWKFLKPLSSHKNQYCYLSTAVTGSDNLISEPFLSADVMETVGSATVREGNCTDSIQHGTFAHWSSQSVFFLKITLKITVNANKLAIWVSCWTPEVPNYLSISRSLKKKSS